MDFHSGPRGKLVVWIAAIAAGMLLLAVAGNWWPGDDEAVVADLESALAVAEAVPAGAPGGSDPETHLRSLREHLDRQPRDARAWVLYARALAERDRFGDAAQAFEKALALSPKVAKDPSVWCEYADALAMAQGGKLAGRPRELIDRALAIDLGHPKALEMAGSAEYEQGRYNEALAYWRPLLAKLAPGTRPHAELAAAIERTERLAASAGRRAN